jgi:hypothetical protein
MSHPSKEEYYTKYCNQKNIAIPNFKNEKLKEDKMINTIYKQYEIDSSLFEGLK